MVYVMVFIATTSSKINGQNIVIYIAYKNDRRDLLDKVIIRFGLTQREKRNIGKGNLIEIPNGFFNSSPGHLVNVSPELGVIYAFYYIVKDPDKFITDICKIH